MPGEEARGGTGESGVRPSARPSSCVPDERFDMPFAVVLFSPIPRKPSHLLFWLSGTPQARPTHPVTLPGLPLAHARQCHLHHSPPHDFGVINPPLLPAVSQKATSPRFRGHGRAEMEEGPGGWLSPFLLFLPSFDLLNVLCCRRRRRCRRCSMLIILALSSRILIPSRPRN